MLFLFLARGLQASSIILDIIMKVKEGKVVPVLN
jgi:hypothetical protein